MRNFYLILGDFLESAEDENLKMILLNFMFLVFQAPDTSRFFFINDLRVLIDTVIRELSDMPAENEIVSSSFFFFFSLIFHDFFLSFLYSSSAREILGSSTTFF